MLILSHLLYIFICSSVILIQFELFVLNFQDGLFPGHVFKIQNLISCTSLHLFCYSRLYPLPLLLISSFFGQLSLFYSFLPLNVLLCPVLLFSASFNRFLLFSVSSTIFLYYFSLFLFSLLFFFVFCFFYCFSLPSIYFLVYFSRPVFPAALVLREKFNIDSFYQ